MALDEEWWPHELTNTKAWPSLPSSSCDPSLGEKQVLEQTIRIQTSGSKNQSGRQCPGSALPRRLVVCDFANNRNNTRPNIPTNENAALLRFFCRLSNTPTPHTSPTRGVPNSTKNVPCRRLWYLERSLQGAECKFRCSNAHTAAN